MPPKRKSRAKKELQETRKLKKEKNAIASRLMEISLKVDDYVYKGIAITPKNAALFIKEVIGYKEKCVEDRRSLQVIEKLERCMKGIINEQQESQNNGDVTDKSKKNCITISKVNSNRATGNPRSILKNKNNSVYNNRVGNDLSWIENLRYVREVTAEEIIPVYYHDSFWEGNTLPNDWNDDIFQ